LSSILKALKKLENESARPDGTQWPRQIHTEPAVPAPMRRHQRLNPLVLILPAAIILSAGGGLFLNRTYLSKKPLPDIEHTEPVRIADPAANTFVKSVVTPVESTTPVNQQTELPLPVAPADPMQDEQIPLDDIQENTPVAIVEQPWENPGSSMEKEIPVATEIEIPEPVSPGNESVAIDAYNDPRVQIQAIAWDPVPENRIAVINDRIIREGSAVEGITVSRIGRDTVIFQEEGKQWEQWFRHRQ
jgi:hypothetical protein